VIEAITVEIQALIQSVGTFFDPIAAAHLSEQTSGDGLAP
jgi:hypothetical protein